MASASDNAAFTKEIISSYPLDEAIEWIGHNLEPEEVFSADHLSQWAEENGYEESENEN